MLSSQTEFAVPAFLKYKAGAEFRWQTKIEQGGGGGEVHIGDALVPRLQESGARIIVKIVGKQRSALITTMTLEFDQELSLMHYIGRHENIAGMLGWCDESMAMLMKYYVNGSLETFLRSKKQLPKMPKISFTTDISQ